MNLIIDIGNTLTKLALFSNSKQVDFKSFENISENELQDYCSKNKTIKHAIVSSVGILPTFIADLLNDRDISLIHFQHTTPLPIAINYQTPESLGMDRLAGVAGAQVLFPTHNCMVIDTGTAITYDIITTNKTFEGGSISPGLQMRYNSLHNFTARLPLIKPEDENILIGKNTKEAIISGVQHGVIYEINGQITHFKKIYDDLKVILTGGDAMFFEKYLKKPIFVEPNLIGIGLNNILEHNVAQI